MPVDSAGNLAEYDLLEVLHAKEGIICAVGAGGKKTTLYALAKRHPGRIGVTSTVLLPPFPRTLVAKRVIADDPTLLPQVVAAARSSPIVAFARHCEKPGRIAGLHPDRLLAIQAMAGFDALLVKADGARMRSIKAPADYEPVIPEGTRTVLALISAATLGLPLSEQIAHRVEHISAVTGARRGQPLRPEHLARLLASDHGALKGVGEATVIPILNAVDDEPRREQAVETAQRALEMTGRFDQVVLAAMHQANPLVQIVRRCVSR